MCEYDVMFNINIVKSKPKMVVDAAKPGKSQ